jgi:hypothetical protein
MADKNVMQNFDETHLGKGHMKGRGDMRITHEK